MCLVASHTARTRGCLRAQPAEVALTGPSTVCPTTETPRLAIPPGSPGPPVPPCGALQQD